MKNMLNSAVRTLMVGKVDLGAFLTEEQIKWELVSNLNDCFLISPECSENMEVSFTLPKSYLERTEQQRLETIQEYAEKSIPCLTDWQLEDAKNLLAIHKTGVANVCPIAGDKFIGANRDKGSVTKLMDRYVPYIQLSFNTIDEYNNFYAFIESIGKVIYKANESKFSFEIQADVVAHPSTTRDNVSALVANSLLEWDAIITGKDEYQLSVDETLDLDVTALVDKYPCGYPMVLRDSETDEIVYSFGEVPVMIEDFFWQPQHGNRFAMKEKEISLNYNQARDCLKVLVPTLAECVAKSANFNSIKEDMLLLGLNIGTATELATFEDLSNSNNTVTQEDEIFNSEVI